ncbi:NAD(+) diphosphatase [Actinocorallia libanotica]|uniref:NAD(+) diphosphatase n=1 Tax=Actinocorallia libanotica TaxID=46162 RepID=A0ABP4BB68_9ACTN
MSLGWLALARGTLDRVAERRRDEDWVTAAWAGCRVLVVDERGRVPFRLDDRPRLAFVPARRAPIGERVLLGVDEDKNAYFAVIATLPEQEGVEVADLRRIGALLDDVESGMMTHAVAMALWHAAHRHCPRCGALTKTVAAGHVRVCPEDGVEQYPRLDPAVIMLVTDDDDRVLLARGTAWPEGRASVLAGFLEPGESLEQGVVREVYEEVGLRVEDVRYLGSQPWPLPQSLMLGFVCHAPGEQSLRLEASEIAEARWYDRQDLLTATLAGDLVLPGKVSIARQLLEHWYGGELPGSWGLGL